jgi:hypothetical protein
LWEVFGYSTHHQFTVAITFLIPAPSPHYRICKLLPHGAQFFKPAWISGSRVGQMWRECTGGDFVAFVLRFCHNAMGPTT